VEVTDIIQQVVQNTDHGNHLWAGMGIRAGGKVVVELQAGGYQHIDCNNSRFTGLCHPMPDSDSSTPTTGKLNSPQGSAVAGFRAGVYLDVRHALRQLWKSKGFALTSLTTLGFCIGTTTAIFSMVYALMLKPLPFNEPGQIVEIYNKAVKAGLGKMPAMSCNTSITRPMPRPMSRSDFGT